MTQVVEFNSLKARTYSRLGQRGAIFGLGIFDAIGQNSNLVVLTADLATLSGLERFRNQYPDNFYNIGIAEQNMLGVAAGLSAEGFLPVATTYATFLSLRSCEQVRHYMGYMQQNIILIGSGAGLSMGFSGNTHYSIEDLAVMRAIPNIVILSPSDAGQAVKAFHAAVELKSPVYIRLSGGLNCPIIYKEEFTFAVGKGIRLKEGEDIQIIATGMMVHKALVVAEILAEKGVSAEVVDMHTIKPLDASIISRNKRMIVTLEEHNVLGGLGSAVAECLTLERNAPCLLRIGIEDTFLSPGDSDYLLEQAGLSVERVVAKVENKLESLV